MDAKIEIGSIINSWCSKHEGGGRSTRHMWEGWRLVCLECYPEREESGPQAPVETMTAVPKFSKGDDEKQKSRSLLNYHASRDDRCGLTGIEYYEWRKLRDEILERDRFTCLRCFKKYKYKKHLSVHHLIPRSEDGGDDWTNLVTLCHPCHDFVEINELKTVAEIIGSLDAFPDPPTDETESLPCSAPEQAQDVLEPQNAAFMG